MKPCCDLFKRAKRISATTRRHGCMEAVDEGVTGFLFEERDTEGLIAQIEKFLAMPIEARAEMGRKARAKMEREFDRQIGKLLF